MAKKKQQEYWYCIVGPVASSKLRRYRGNGADAPLRMGVHKGIEVLESRGVEFDSDLKISSGWGISESEVEAIKDIRYRDWAKKCGFYRYGG